MRIQQAITLVPIISAIGGLIWKVVGRKFDKPRLKVTIDTVIQNQNGHLTFERLDIAEVPFEYLNQYSSPAVSIKVTNKSRLTATVELVELTTRSKHHLPLLLDRDLQRSTNIQVLPFSSQYWTCPLEDVADLFNAAQSTKKGNFVRAKVHSPGVGILSSGTIPQRHLAGFAKFWHAILEQLENQK